jgi:hypothetical protein
MGSRNLTAPGLFLWPDCELLAVAMICRLLARAESAQGISPWVPGRWRQSYKSLVELHATYMPGSGVRTNPGGRVTRRF